MNVSEQKAELADMVSSRKETKKTMKNPNVKNPTLPKHSREARKDFTILWAFASMDMIILFLAENFRI